MAAPLSGRYCSVTIGGVSIASLGHWEINGSFDTAESGEFGQTAKIATPMMYGWSGRVEGFLDAGTSAGSHMYELQDKAFDGTLIQDIKFYTQLASNTSAEFWMPNCSTVAANQTLDAGCYITNFSITADFNGLAKASYDVLGTGPIAIFAGASTMILCESTL
jgi:hypothetical protein